MLCKKLPVSLSPDSAPDSLEMRIRLTDPTLIKLMSIAVAVVFSSSLYGGL